MRFRVRGSARRDWRGRAWQNGCEVGFARRLALRVRGPVARLTSMGLVLAGALVCAPTAGAAASCTPSSSYSQAVAGTAGVVSYWRLGEPAGSSTACDSVATNAGSYYGGVTSGQPGALYGDPGTSTSFDGSTGYVGVPDSTSLHTGDTFSVEAWVKRGSLNTANTQVIASKQTGSWVLLFNSANRLVLRQSGNADIVASTRTVSDTSSWHYVAATKNGSSVHLYIDGTDVTGTVANQTLTNNTLRLLIGESLNASYFSGSIEEVAVYKQALTASQIANHYQLGAPPSCPKPSSSYSQAVAATAGVVSYWRLSDPAGSTTACDGVGTNPGSYTGGVTLGQPGGLLGDPGSSTLLDGSSGYVSVPDSTSLHTGDAFSIEAWVKRATVGTPDTQVIASKQAGSWTLQFNSSDQLVLAQAGNAGIAWSWSRVTDTTNWHYVVATKNGAVVHLFVDGVDVTGTVSNQTLTSNTLPLVIGDSPGSFSYFNGSLEDVAIYSQALTAAQVANHYQLATGVAPQTTAGGTGATLGTVATAGSGDPEIAAAGDIACGPDNADYNSGVGDANGCQQASTAKLMAGNQLAGMPLSAILPLGDDQYEAGATAEFSAVYDGTWGAYKNISYPVPGNHEYQTPAAINYFDYFDGYKAVTGDAGNAGAGYYSFNLGAWHLIALNSNCSLLPGGCGAGSPEERWLAHDLAGDTAACTLAYWHHPLFSSGTETGGQATKQLFTDLYNAHATLVLNGHDHQYERFAPQDPNGNLDPTNGIVEFVAGTGGYGAEPFGSTIAPNSLVRQNTSYGVLRLGLHATSYDYQFVPSTGSFTDSGSGNCRNTVAHDTVAPTSTAASPADSNQSPWTVSYSASDNGGGDALARVDLYARGPKDSTYAPVASNPGSGTSGSFSYAATEGDGSYSFYTIATDQAGNVQATPATGQASTMLDTVAPASTIACNKAACAGWYTAPVSVTFGATENAGGSGVASIVYTTDGSDPSLTNGLTYTGAFSIPSTVTVKYRAYDNAGNAEPVNTQVIQIDTTPPSSSMSCNGATCQSGFYNGPVPVSLSAVDGPGSGVAAIYYTTDGSTPTATSADLYFGPFQLSSTGTVNYFSVDNAGNAEPVNSQTISITPPGVTMTSPAAGSTVSGTTNLTAAVSGMNAAYVAFSIDGQAVGSVTSSPFTLPWDSTSVPNGTHTIVAAAFDASGAETDSTPITVTVSNNGGDTTPPTSAIACNGGGCSGWFQNAVSVSLSATDNSGGSGVASIVYTTDGSDPSLTNGSVYTGPFSLATTATVKYRAYDNAGNAEPVSTQLVQVDTVAPSSSISCNGTSCASSFYNSAVPVSLNAADNVGGSGVASIVYTTDGSTPSTSNGTAYTGPLSLNATTTVRYRAYDVAGNAEPVNSALIQIDTTPPASAIACNGGPCSGWSGTGVSVSLSATDNTGGSGVASIRYTTNGSTPSLTNGTKYSGPFSLSATTTVNYRAYDNVGNAEAVNTQVVQVDGTPPSVSLTAPGAGLAAGTVSLSANASDNVGVDHVDFLVDGSVVGTVKSAPYAFTWNSATVPDGSHTVTARAVDLAGNATTSGPVTVTVANNNLLQNASLETASGSTPTCWVLGGYGTNTFTWTRTTDAHSGSFAENLNITSYTSGDRKFVNRQDSGTCAPTANPGHTYTVTAWYKVPTGSASPMFFAYYRNSSGSWVYWTASAHYASSSGWKQATWTTPAVPAGATNLSVGMGLDGVGSVTMDDFGLYATG